MGYPHKSRCLLPPLVCAEVLPGLPVGLLSFNMITNAFTETGLQLPAEIILLFLILQAGESFFPRGRSPPGVDLGPPWNDRFSPTCPVRLAGRLAC